MYPYSMAGQPTSLSAARVPGAQPGFVSGAQPTYLGGSAQRFGGQVMAATPTQAQSGAQLNSSQMYVPQSTAQIASAAGQTSAAPFINQNSVTTPRGPQPALQQPSPGSMPVTSISMQPTNKLTAVSPVSAREQALEARIRELESIVASKDETIMELRNALANSGPEVGGHKRQPKASGQQKVVAGQGRSPGRSASGFRKLADAKPAMKYTAADQDDPIDIRLEEFYNSTGSAIPFRRINKGFYRFGDSIVELDIINHKLMARTEDGWNRGKFGPIEKFLTFYENIEREKAGISAE